MTDLFFTNIMEYHELGMKGSKEYRVKGYISTDEVDRANDVVTKDCMQDMVRQIKAGNVKLDVEHSTFTGENDIPVGRIIDAGIDAKGLWIEATLNRAHEKFETIWKSIKDGFLDAFSIAYKTKEFAKSVVNGAQVTLLKAIELLNVAITGNPVNRGARMTESFYKSMRYADAEEKSMSEEQEVKEEPKVEEKVEEQPEEPKVEEKPEEPKEEEKSEEPVEEKPEEPAEEPEKEEPVEEKPEELQINPLDQIKSLRAELVEMKSLQKELEDAKAELKSTREDFLAFKKEMSKPQLKGFGETDIAEVKEPKEETKNPLDRI